MFGLLFNGGYTVRQFTRKHILAAAAEGLAFCLKCGEEQGYGEDAEGILPCENCGALAVIPASNIQAVLNLVKGDEDE